MIIVLFGQPCTGKTTLANHILIMNRPAILIDGDDLRSVFNNKDYSKQGRINNIQRAIDIALWHHEKYQHNVIMSLIFPYQIQREILNNLKQPAYFIYLVKNDDDIRGREKYQAADFEIPDDGSLNKFMKLNTSLLTEKECLKKINLFINNV